MHTCSALFFMYITNYSPCLTNLTMDISMVALGYHMSQQYHPGSCRSLHVDHNSSSSCLNTNLQLSPRKLHWITKLVLGWPCPACPISNTREESSIGWIRSLGSVGGCQDSCSLGGTVLWVLSSHQHFGLKCRVVLYAIHQHYCFDTGRERSAKSGQFAPQSLKSCWNGFHCGN